MPTQDQGAAQPAPPSTAVPHIPKPKRRSKYQDVRDRALADPSRWHYVRTFDDPEQARLLATRIRRGISRWGPAGTYDARERHETWAGESAGTGVWIRSLIAQDAAK